MEQTNIMDNIEAMMKMKFQEMIEFIRQQISLNEEQSVQKHHYVSEDVIEDIPEEAEANFEQQETDSTSASEPKLSTVELHQDCDGVQAIQKGLINQYEVSARAGNLVLVSSEAIFNAFTMRKCYDEFQCTLLAAIQPISWIFGIFEEHGPGPPPWTKVQC